VVRIEMPLANQWRKSVRAIKVAPCYFADITRSGDALTKVFVAGRLLQSSVTRHPDKKMNNAKHNSIIEIIGRISDFVLDADAADEALELMARSLDSDKAVLVRLAADRRRDIALANYNVPRDLINSILSERENPETFLAHDAHWESGRVATDSDCKRTVERRSSSKIFLALLRPNGIEHTLLGVIETSDLHHILLWFHRGPERRAYNQSDKAFFETLMPHWQRAIQQKLTFDYMASSLTAARQVLDQSPFGLHFLNRAGRILFSNAAGKTQCRARVGISMRNQTLTFSNREVRAAFDAMLAAAKHGGREDDPRLQPIMFGKTTLEGSYQLGMRRLKMPGERGSLATRRVIAVFIYDTGKRMELSIEGLRSLYDLTEAEARVCDLLYQSRNLPEAAKMLGISINTAKTHLNRSFRKVGVQSQAELVRRLNSQLYIS